MIDLDKSVFKSVLHFQDMQEVYQSDFKEIYLEDTAREAYKFIENYFRENGFFPSYELFHSQTGFELSEDPLEPMKVLVPWLKERFIYRKLKRFGDSFAMLMEKNKAQDAKALMERYLSEITTQVENNTLLEPMFYEGLLQDFKDTKEETTSTPMPLLDERLGGGLQGGDLIVVSARPAVGKTFYLIWWLIHFYRQGKKVLLVSNEMASKTMRMRGLSILSKTNYSKMRKFIDPDEEKRINHILQNVDPERFKIMSKGFGLNVEAIATHQAIHDFDVIGVDSAYLLGTAMQSKDRFEKVMRVFQTLKQIAKDSNIR